MFCPECGMKNGDQAVFCENCGKKIIQPNKDNEQVITKETNTVKAKKKVSFDKKQKFIFAESVILIILVVSILVLQKKFMTAEYTAQQWVKAVEEQDWGKAYNLLYLPDGDGKFLTKQNFVTAYSIDSNDENKNKVEILGAYKTNIMESSDKKKTVEVDYMSSGESDSRVLEVIKRKGKWKINGTSEFIAKDVTVSVPQGSKVQINKEDVKDSGKKSTKDGKDIYVFGKMFNASHYINVSVEGMQNYKGIIRPGDSEYNEIALQYEKDVLKTVAKQAKEDLSVILNAAAQGENGNQVTPISDMNKTYQRDAIELYDDIRSAVTFTDHDMRRDEFISLKLSDNNTTVGTGAFEDGTLGITVEIDSAYNYVMRSGISDETIADADRNINVLKYVKQDDKWKLYQLDLSTSY